MSTEIVLVVVMTAMAVGCLVWLEMKSRRNGRGDRVRRGPRQDNGQS